MTAATKTSDSSKSGSRSLDRILILFAPFAARLTWAGRNGSERLQPPTRGMGVDHQRRFRPFGMSLESASGTIAPDPIPHHRSAERHRSIFALRASVRCGNHHRPPALSRSVEEVSRSGCDQRIRASHLKSRVYCGTAEFVQFFLAFPVRTPPQNRNYKV